MESWTPEQWGIFIAALAVGLGAVITPLAALGKYYIDHLGKASDEKIRVLESAVKQLQHDRKRDRRRIKQLVQALRDNNIPVPPELPDPDDEQVEE